MSNNLTVAAKNVNISSELTNGRVLKIQQSLEREKIIKQSIILCH